MKLLLSALFTGALVMAPAPAEAKSARTQTCTGVQTVEIRHGHKVTRSYLACPQKTRPKTRFAPIFTIWN